MNTAPQCRSHLVCVAPSEFELRNGMEEVVGSIPTRSTIKSIIYKMFEQLFGSTPATAEKPGTRTTKHFEALHKLVDGPPGGAPIDTTLKAIGQIQQQLAGIGVGLGSSSALSTVTSAGQAGAIDQLRIAAMQLPAPISGIVAQVGAKGESVAKAEDGGELSRRSLPGGHRRDCEYRMRPCASRTRRALAGSCAWPPRRRGETAADRTRWQSAGSPPWRPSCSRS